MKLKLVKVKEDVPVSERGFVLNKNVSDTEYWKVLMYRPGEAYFVRDHYLYPETQWEVVSCLDSSRNGRLVPALLKEHCAILKNPIALYKCFREERNPVIETHLDCVDRLRADRRSQLRNALVHKNKLHEDQLGRHLAYELRNDPQ